LHELARNGTAGTSRLGLSDSASFDDGNRKLTAKKIPFPVKVELGKNESASQQL
jgi:hypothetical protein